MAHESSGTRKQNVEAETVVRVVYDIHFQINIKDNDVKLRKLCY